MKKMITLVGGIALGATVGAVATALSAPRSGKETREAIKEGSQRLRKRLVRGTKEAVSADPA